ncbi:MAG TPA: plastocyanin/azurin family copper-binding protein [Fimbriimonadaceae bacterium]|nr:plastocyanin/azurin family copper-binding protein [Fimbriimonadaceae bacterium]
MKARHYVIFLLAVIGILIGCMGGGGSSNTTSSTSTATTSGGGNTTVDVSMTGSMTFSPKSVVAHAGDTIQWTNNGAMPHTVLSDTGVTGLDSSTSFVGGMQPGDVFTWAVPANATVGMKYYYHCTFHGTAGNGSNFGTGMTGVITVD